MGTEPYIPIKARYAGAKANAHRQEEQPPCARPQKEQTKQEQKSQGSASQQVIVHPTWFLPTSESAPSLFHIIFPKRSGNNIEFYKSSRLVFEALEKAIRKANKSVDIISMGIDTDLRLDRNGECRRILRYSKVYPATVDKQYMYAQWEKEKAHFRGTIPAPDPHSSVLSDLLTRRAVAENAIVVRMIIGAPRQFIGNTFYDPLHLWWRCKTLPEYKNRIRFALRDAKGVFNTPGTPPIKGTEKLSKDEQKNIERTEDIDSTVRTLWRLIPFVGHNIYTHHQKLYLIDIEEPDATAFIIGSNANEDYWDDYDHLAHNMNRYPYRAWHDSGLSVKGPVLYDIAKTFEEAWDLLKDQEVLPSELVRKAFQAYMNGVQLGHSPAMRFNFLEDFAAVYPLEKESPFWGATLPRSPDYYKPDTKAAGMLVETQFARTFAQEGAPIDFSIRKLIYRAVTLVKPGGLIYIENQYFRDLWLVEQLTELGRKHSELPLEKRPKVIILTNDPFLNENESSVAAGPTFMTYQNLQQCGLPYLFCKLETKEWPEYTYADPRYA